MRNYVLMADVNADVKRSFAEEENISIFPQYYHFNDGVIYGDEQVLELSEFYRRLEKERAYSMGCNPERVRGIMEDALKQEKDIIAFMASSECSVSYNTVLMEAQELMEKYPGSRIVVIDTRFECAPINLMVRTAVQMKKNGKSFDEIVEAMEKAKNDANIYFLVDHLDYLVRGGRLSPISGAVGTMLNIKPILYFEDGKIVAYAKARGRQVGKKMIMDSVKKLDPSKYIFTVAHTLAREEAQAFAGQLQSELGLNIVSVDDVNPTIGTHTGPNAIALAYMRLPE